jgi:hypothetical protein
MSVQQYQDPAAADKITKIQKELEETKQVLAPAPSHPPLSSLSLSHHENPKGT